MVAERIPSEGSERARGLGSEVGERLGESTEARRARRAWWRGDSEGLEGAWSPGCLQCTRMRGAVGVSEADARECQVQRAIEHSRVTVERGVKHSRALKKSAQVTARALVSVSPRKFARECYLTSELYCTLYFCDLYHCVTFPAKPFPQKIQLYMHSYK